MIEPQTLREVLENELKNLEEKENKAKKLEAEAQKIKVEIERKQQKLFLALGLNSKEKVIAKRKPWNLNKPDSLVMQILIAMRELEKNGSKVTSTSIRNQLVGMDLYAYENLKINVITSRISYLHSVRKLISIKTKRGRETTYQFTEAGKKIAETMGLKK